jgi:hypothetical protein
VANQTKTYGEDDPALAGITPTLTGLVNRTVVDWNGTSPTINDSGLTSGTTSLTRVGGENVGSYNLTSGVFTTPSANYSAPTLTAGSTLTIGTASLTGSVSSNPSKIYGASDPVPGSSAVTLTGVINNPVVVTWNGNIAINDNGNVTGTPSSLTRVAGENVGAYNYTGGTLALSGSAVANYAGAAFVPGGSLLNITPAALAVTADDKSRLIAAPNPPFTASYSGFQFSDTAASLTGTLVFNAPAGFASPAGTYSIVPSGQTSNNYVISYVNGSLTVTPQSAASPSSVNGIVFDQMPALQRLGINDATRTMPNCGDKGGASGGASLANTVVTVAGQCGIKPSTSAEVSR